MFESLKRHAAEFRRALRNFRFELTGNGLYLPKQQMGFFGQFMTSLNGAPWVVERNLVVNEGITHILGSALGGETQVSAYFIAPFLANVTPVAGLTAANFDSTQTEFTYYAETTRQAWVADDIDTDTFIENTTAPATITVGGAGPVQTTIWGAGLLSANAKESVAGKLVACAKFAAARDALQVDDELRFKYRITGVAV